MDASSSSTEYRPHRTTSINSSTTTTATTTTSELFICFTSRLSSSSSSMKISSNSNSNSNSKSILSPGRPRDSSQQISLSSSLSRRLRTNGSIKGGQASPMFPSGGKKRGGAGYDNPEPNSPKVTCIGQVRVKSKKKQQAKKLRNGSQRKGEVSFRKLELSRSGHHSFQQQQHLGNTPEGHRNQRWVHFPVTICEALRTFGADWNCFLPCRSSCMSSKEDKSGSGGGGGGSGSGGGSSCGAVIARWLVAVQDGEGNGRREIELVVGGEEMDDRSYRSQRRHIFDGLDFSEEKKEAAAAAKEDEGGGRVSISIPPKNALLLMRCRSDPVKMAALANRFCERSDEDDEKDGEGEAEEVAGVIVEEEVKFEQEMEEELKDEEIEEQKILEEAESSLMVEEEEEEVYEEVKVNDYDLEPESDEKMKEEDDGEDEELELLCGFLFRDAEEDEFVDANGDDEDDDGSESAEMDEAPELDESVNWEAEEEDAEKPLEAADTRPETAQNLEPDEGDPNRKPNKVREREDSRLPECLLLMMCEPKLSMEVSKETWVCSTDFIRWLPERHSNKAAAAAVEEEPVKKRNSTDRRPRATGLTAHQTRILQQPPRNSVSFPAQAMVAARRSSVGSGDGDGESMAAVIEKKLRSAKGGEPLALTRCKSEPMRSAIKLAAPDSCFWKNRKMEPHRPPRVKAAGVGF